MGGGGGLGRITEGLCLPRTYFLKVVLTVEGYREGNRITGYGGGLRFRIVDCVILEAHWIW